MNSATEFDLYINIVSVVCMFRANFFINLKGKIIKTGDVQRGITNKQQNIGL